jgi:peptidoglycan/LPS O-acetylase OafA/YrhL
MTAPQRTAREGHRPDIDALRAIAVLAVILFHIDPSWVPGGFVGVDVFFVISGYLITGHMAGELAAGRFSLAEFYRRRIKRIAPAMLLVVGVSLVVGWWLLLPEDLANLAKSAVWSIASLANVYFWREINTDYFGPGGESLPLLHLWSLGLEEQFYLLWPLLLIAIWKLASPGRARTLSLGFALLLVPLSCLLTAWGYERDGMFVYYMLPTRAGELGTGAALALWLQGGSSSLAERLRPLAAALAVLGLLLLAGTLATLSEFGPFPGWRSLAPTIGTALVIAAGGLQHDHKLVRWLSLRPLLWIGAVSYSAYLWHWPLLAYWRYLFGQPGPWIGLALLAATFLLSWLSYRWIEQPARQTKASARAVLVRLFIAPGALLAAAALVVIYGPRLGFGGPSEEYIAQRIDAWDEALPAYHFDWACQQTRVTEQDLDEPACVVGARGNAAPVALLWGDSNAAHFIPMFDVLAEKAGYRLRNIEIGNCPPLLSDPRPFVLSSRYADCVASQREVRKAMAAYPVIILAGSWTEYQHRSSDFLPQLEATVTQLLAQGHQLRLIGKLPVFPRFDRRCAQKVINLPWLDCSVAPRAMGADVAQVNEALRQMAARHPGVVYFEANGYLCPGELCSINAADGQQLYFDASHLSVEGSSELGRQIYAREGVPAALDLSAVKRHP